MEGRRQWRWTRSCAKWRLVGALTGRAVGEEGEEVQEAQGRRVYAALWAQDEAIEGRFWRNAVRRLAAARSGWRASTTAWTGASAADLIQRLSPAPAPLTSLVSITASPMLRFTNQSDISHIGLRLCSLAGPL